MKTDWKKKAAFAKRVLVFLGGGIVLSYIFTAIIYSFFEGWLSNFDEQTLRKLIANPVEEIAETSSKLYLVSYILFGALPLKIKQATWFLRGIYFTVFYLFCYLVLLWM